MTQKSPLRDRARAGGEAAGDDGNGEISGDHGALKGQAEVAPN